MGRAAEKEAVIEGILKCNCRDSALALYLNRVYTAI